MKTLLLLGAALIVFDGAIFSTSAQTPSASPAGTVSRRSTPGSGSPAPRPSLEARPYATASPAPSGAATSSPSTARVRDARVTPAATVSPSGGAQLEGESPHPATRESSPKAATSAGMTPTPSRPHRKLERREANTPPPGDGSGEHR
jgi:hypothetical protein